MARGVRATVHRPDADLSLAREHALSLDAIGNILAALRQAYDILFRVAAEFYPRRWTELVPRMVTVASWVGYDLDGRSDIRWSDTLLKRLRLAVNSLVTYSDLAPRVFAAAGTLMIVGPLLYGSIVLLQYLFAGRSLPQGLTMIVLLITFLGGTIMLALGVLGLYIFRIFQEVLARPRYVIDETMNLERFPHGRS